MILLLSCVTHVLFLFTRKAAYDRWLFNGTWTFFIDSYLNMTFIFFVLFECTSRYLCHWWTNFPLKVCLDVTHEHIHIENRNRDLCGYLRHVGLSTQKSRFRGFPRWHLMACVKIRLLAIKQRALKWYTKLSVHCSQFLFSGLLHPLQPSCFQITLRSQSSHESAAAESSLCL